MFPRKLVMIWTLLLVVLGGGLGTVQFLHKPTLDGKTGNVVGETSPDDLSGVTELPIAIPASYDALIQPSDLYGRLPRISPDGRLPWRVYGAQGAQDNDTRPRIALILTDLGNLEQVTDLALNNLPQGITVAFSPYGRDLDRWVSRTRDRGLEMLLMMPMEPQEYPAIDPGVLTLQVDFLVNDNLHLVRQALGKMTGYVGIINQYGSRFLASVDSIQGPILDEVKRRGLMLVDTRETPASKAIGFARARDIPAAVVNRRIDRELVPALIVEQLKELEADAARRGYAVGIARARPLTIELISAWARTLGQSGFVLVPISSVANRQPETSK